MNQDSFDSRLQGLGDVLKSSHKDYAQRVIFAFRGATLSDEQAQQLQQWLTERRMWSEDARVALRLVMRMSELAGVMAE